MSTELAIASAMSNRELTRSMQMLTGLVTGIVADGQLHDLEIQLLNTWLTSNPDVTATWPGSAIARHVREVLQDGIVTADERAHLLNQLQSLAGSDFSETGSADPSVAALPYDLEAVIAVRDLCICHTGEFIYGTRSACEGLTAKAGGIPASSVTKKVAFLVVGTHVSPAWVNTTYGRKIMRAMELRDAGHSIAVVSEKRWLEALQG